MKLKSNKNQYPKVKIKDIKLSENIYSWEDRSWDVPTLIQYCKEKEYPIFDLPLCSVDLSRLPFKLNNVKELIYQIDRINKTDLKYPILISDTGYICDGWHRICKAILNGYTVIKAIRIEEMPHPSSGEAESY